MTEVSNEGRVRIAIRVLRFIVVAMLIGLAVEPVLLSVITRGHEGEADAGFTYTLLGVLVALGLAELVAYPFVRKVMMDRLRADFQPAEPGVLPVELLQPFTSLRIIAAAMAMGFSLFSLVVFFVTGHPAGIVAAVIGALVLIGLYPSESQYRRFVAAVGGAPV